MVRDPENLPRLHRLPKGRLIRVLANLGFGSPYLGPVFGLSLPVDRRSRVMNSVRVYSHVSSYGPWWSKKFYVWTRLGKEHVLRSCKTREVELGSWIFQQHIANFPCRSKSAVITVSAYWSFATICCPTSPVLMALMRG